MNTEFNTQESVKVMLPISLVKRIRDVLPGGSINRIAAEMGVNYQNITYHFNKIPVNQLSDDNQSRLISKDLIERAVKIIQETGNESFDYVLKLIEQ